MKVGALTPGTRRVEVEIEGSDERVGVVYRPAALTADAVRIIVDPESTDDDARKVLSEILESWEIEGNDGEPYATTPEAIGALPLEFVGMVVNAIVTKAGVVPEGRGGA